jgi:hypothetical protein
MYWFRCDSLWDSILSMNLKCLILHFEWYWPPKWIG